MHRIATREATGKLPMLRTSTVAADTGGAITLVALFAGLAVAVLTGRTQQVDDRLRRAQRHPRRGLRRDVAVAVKEGGKPAAQLPIGAAITGLLHAAEVPGATAVAAAAVGVFVADKSIKHLVDRRRPSGYVARRERYESFPSGHTAATAAVSLTTAGLLQRAGVVRAPLGTCVALLMTAGVGETRLILDEHWPSDVLAGALLGGATALAALAIAAHAGPADV